MGIGQDTADFSPLNKLVYLRYYSDCEVRFGTGSKEERGKYTCDLSGKLESMQVSELDSGG